MPMPEPVTYAQDHAVAIASSEKSWLRQAWVLQAFVLLALIAVLYHSISAALVLDWWNDPNFSHGFIIPAFSLFVAWQQRKRLAALPLAASWFGLVIIAGALVVLIVGVLGAELFLSRSSLV